MTIPSPKPGSASRTALLTRLIELRKAAGLSGNALAKRMGIVQSRVWKIEHREVMPTEDDLKAWATETGREDAISDLLLMLAGARSEQAFSVEFRRQGGPAAFEQRVLETEEASTRIGEFQVAVIPGIFHTADYARAILNLTGGLRWWGANDAAIEDKIDVRLRRQELLYRPGRQFQIVISEGALRTLMAPPDVMVAQLDKLASLAQLPAVDLGVIGFSKPMPVYPFGFRLYDSNLVVVESTTGETELTPEQKPEDVAAFLAQFDELRRVASTGPEAEALIAAAAADLRS